jgi:hypothetical protein
LEQEIAAEEWRGIFTDRGDRFFLFDLTPSILETLEEKKESRDPDPV